MHDEMYENEYVNNELSRNWITGVYGKLMNNSCSGYLKISLVFRACFIPCSYPPRREIVGEFS